MRVSCWIFAAIGAVVLFHNAPQARAELLFTVNTNNFVNIVDTSNPQVVTSSGAISGLGAGENVLALDYRANGGGIYAITSLSNIFTIDRNTLVATQVGGTLSTPLAGTSFAFDFNPAAAGSSGNGTLARIISDTDNNRVIDSVAGGYFGAVEKTPVFYQAGDVNAGLDPNIQGIAYSNNIAGSAATQQFGIDASLGVLTTVANNNGNLATIGSLGLAGLTNEVAFDISGESGTAYASLQLLGGSSSLYSIDTGTGAATFLGDFGGDTIRDFTIIPAAVPEPSSLAVLGVAAVGVYLLRRKSFADLAVNRA